MDKVPTLVNAYFYVYMGFLNRLKAVRIWGFPKGVYIISLMYGRCVCDNYAMILNFSSSLDKFL